MPPRWKSVPMPDRVAALPRDKRGFPVPWVSCWEPSDLSAQVMEWNGFSFAAAHCSHVAGQGEPDLGNLCSRNQIKGMLERLCDVCGEFIPPGPIYFLGAADIPMQGVGFRECGLHLECALYSARVCPGLVTPARGKVAVMEARAYMIRPEFMFKSPIADDDELIRQAFEGFNDPALRVISALGRTVLMGVYAVLIDPKITPMHDWIETQLAVLA